MNLTEETLEKKKSKSFWNRLLHLPRKSNKEKHEDSFMRQSKLYSSLSTTKHETQSNISSDESVNFVMLESSTFSDVHRDAGILFLNKESNTNCFAPREENKHVQFVPTPMNKYYRVDIKSAPSKKQKDENKENLEETKSTKPARPILRLDKNRKVNLQSSSDAQSNIETRLVNVTYIEGPLVKTPSIPRTSTKLALVDHKNGSVPMLNVSNIVKYNSLPRNAETIRESNSFREKNPALMSQSGSVKSIESLPLHQSRNERHVSDMDKHRRSIRNLNSHRQSCYGVSDPSRIIEGQKVLQAQNQTSNQDTKYRYSLGGPIVHPSQITNDANYRPENIPQTRHLITETHSKNIRKFLKSGMPSRGPSYARSLDQPIQTAPIHGCQPESNCNKMKWQHHHASTGHIPNKAINEIGLPLATSKQNRDTSNGTSKLRSKSPHYVPLCETFTVNKNVTGKKDNTNQPNKYLNQQANGKTLSKTISQKQKITTCAGALVEGKNKKSKSDTPNAEHCNEKSGFISETRKHAIKSALYTQKRKMVNKICKYNSKQCEDGFSSMADDECSFNCSCPSCIVKLSRSYKRNGIKNLFSFNKDNKYFFTIEPDIQEGNEAERLPENQTFEGPMAKAQPHLSNKLENKAVLKNMWYECNDTLCETPHKSKSSKRTELEALALEPCKTPTNKIVDNIYENITDIINSATKRNLKPQDIKKILSTPICSPLRVDNMMKSLTKPQRVLFPDEHKTLDQSLKQMFTPEKNTDCFNDSIVLLQEIFQKLSQECKELLQPNTSSAPGYSVSRNNCDISPSNRYVNDLVKNLKSTELSEADFAIIIGGIAQNIFSETKAKQKIKPLTHSASMPDLKRANFADKAISAANSLKELLNLHANDQLIIKQNTKEKSNELMISGDSVLGSRHLPDGWSRTPTTENSNLSNDTSTKLSSSGTDKDSSKYSENELQLLENAIRLGMGLDPVDKVKKTAPTYVASPTKASKYKSRDVLSGKGKLKLKIYNNSGLVTVYVMKATKLSWTNGRELNSYVKITMIPDDSKRVHWRTAVQKAERNPVFNQKFSFELLAEDETKRLVFSVWHRDYMKQRSELIGCMSFSVRHVMDNAHNVDGWYRLLREKFGTQKHFAAHTNKNSNCTLLVPV